VPHVITLVDDDGRHTLQGHADGPRLLADPHDFARSTGWQLTPEGLCRGDVCVPVRERTALLGADGHVLDVGATATALGLECVVDAARQVVAIGPPASAIGETMASLAAPAFTLPDLDGEPVSLADFDRRKRLLLAWSSW
jgi:hypothetical protein